MRVLIVEDEAIAAEHLSRIVNGLRPDWEILATIPSISEGLKWFSKNETPDLVFSDIQLTDGLSFELYELHYDSLSDDGYWEEYYTYILRPALI